jgi:hypothetical protein
MVVAWVHENGLLGCLAHELDFLMLPSGRAVVPRPGEALTWDLAERSQLIEEYLPKGVMGVRTPGGIALLPSFVYLPDFFQTKEEAFYEEAFWGKNFKRVYGEPLSLIAFEAIQCHQHALAPHGPEAFRWLTERAGSALPHFRSQAGVISYEHSSPTLLASLCLMLLWDLMDGLSVGVCVCGQPFVRAAAHVKLCSDRCRRREKMRRYRGRKKEGRASTETEKDGVS